MIGNTKKGSVWGGTKAAVWGLSILTLVFGFALVGCGGDDDDDPGGGGGPTTPAEIQGTWARERGGSYTVYIIGEKDAKWGGSGISQDDAITQAKADATPRAYKGEEDGYYKFGEEFLSFNVTKVDGNSNQLKIGGDIYDKVTE